MVKKMSVLKELLRNPDCEYVSLERRSTSYELVEISNDYNEIVATEEAIERLEEINESLSSILTVSIDSLNENGLTSIDSKILQASTESLLSPLGLDSPIPSIDLFENEWDRRSATEVSIEGIVEKITKIWNAIKKAIIDLARKIKEWFANLFKSSEKEEKRTEELSKTILSLVDSSEPSPKKAGASPRDDSSSGSPLGLSAPEVSRQTQRRESRRSSDKQETDSKVIYLYNNIETEYGLSNLINKNQTIDNLKGNLMSLLVISEIFLTTPDNFRVIGDAIRIIQSRATKYNAGTDAQSYSNLLIWTLKPYFKEIGEKEIDSDAFRGSRSSTHKQGKYIVLKIRSSILPANKCLVFYGHMHNEHLNYFAIEEFVKDGKGTGKDKFTIPNKKELQEISNLNKTMLKVLNSSKENQKKAEILRKDIIKVTDEVVKLGEKNLKENETSEFNEALRGIRLLNKFIDNPANSISNFTYRTTNHVNNFISHVLDVIENSQ